MKSVFSSALLLAAIAGAQNPPAVNPPAVNPRGVLNAYSLAPALSTAGRGGLIAIAGINLGPDTEVVTPGLPWPVSLGDPAVEVSIAGRPAPIYSVSATKIVAQVPFETAPGIVEVTVKRAGLAGRVARLTVTATEPSVRSASGNGSGATGATQSGSTLNFVASGFGVTSPVVGTGEAATADSPAAPTAPVVVYIGGLKTNSVVSHSTTRPGEYDVQVEVPAAARPGDVLTVVSGNRASSRTTYQSLAAPELQFLKLPAGSPDLRAIVSPDLNGNYWIGSAARDADGCYPSLLFDAMQQSVSSIEGCLTSGNANAITPLIAPNDGPSIAALAGPPLAAAPEGVSSKVRIFDPSRPAPLSVDLPGAASQLAGAGGGNFSAVIPGNPNRVVVLDAQTGELQDGPAGAGGNPGIQGVLLNLQVNVEGLASLLSLPVQLPQGRFGVVVGDDSSAPKQAKFAILTAAGEVAASKDFPDGWQPLIAPAPPANPGGGPGGGGPGGGGAVFQIPRGTVSYDAGRRMVYALARTSDNARHGMAAFTLDAEPSKAIPFPDGWYAPTCTTQIRIVDLDLGRQKALVATNVQETAFKNVCPGVGFILLDLESETMSAVPLPGTAQFNASAGTSGEVNDYVYGTNSDPARPNTSDSLFVLDGASNSAYRLDLPSGVTSFGNVTVVAQLGLLVAAGTNRVAGDAGLVVFDLDRLETRRLAVPDGFATVAEVGVFPATRKLVARGVKPQNAGSQLLVYDLATADVAVVANPEGVDSVGPAQAAPGGGGPGGVFIPGGGFPGGLPGGLPVGGPGAGAAGAGQARLMVANSKANSVAAIALAADGKQAGIVVLRVP